MGGRVAAGLTDVAWHGADGEAVGAAHTYFTNQQGRMNYPAYRVVGCRLEVGPSTAAAS